MYPAPIFITTLASRAPTVMRRALRLMPNAFVQGGLEAGLNRIFKPFIADGRLKFMKNRKLCIRVSDIDLTFMVTLPGEVLRISADPSGCDVTFRTQATDLLQLITGREDPDTLFFSRRLSISGDTELGLEVKNFLDTLEADTLLPRPVYQTLSHLAAHTAEPHK